MSLGLCGLTIVLSLGLSGCQPDNPAGWTAHAGRFFISGVQQPALSAQATQDFRSLSHYMSGLISEGLGDLKRAKHAYLQAQSHDPESIQMALRYGTVCMRTEDMDQAIGAFERVAHMDQKDPRPHFLLGVLYTSQEDFDRAAEHYSQVLTLDPKNLGAMSYLADLYILQDNLEKGVQVYERLLEERPDSPVGHFNVGILYAKAEVWDRSIDHLREAIELDPTYLEARLGLAVSMELSGDVIGAYQVFLEAHEVEPYNVQLIHYLAQIAHKLGNYEQSAEWLTRYLSFQPRDQSVHLELIQLRLKQRDYVAAMEQLDVAKSLYQLQEQIPDDLWIAEGLAYQGLGDFESAEASLRKGVLLFPKSTKPALYLLVLYQKQKRYKEAEVLYRRQLAMHPDDARLLNGIGYLYAEWGVELEKALDYVHRALELDPGNPSYLDSLGWVYFKMGRPSQARPLLEEAASMEPDPEILDHLAQVYVELNEFGLAKQAWEKALLLVEEGTLAEAIQHRLKSL